MHLFDPGKGFHRGHLQNCPLIIIARVFYGYLKLVTTALSCWPEIDVWESKVVFSY